MLHVLPGFAGSRLVGQVTDSDNAPLIGASVVLEDTPLGSSTDLDGHYQITQIPPGIYTVRASMMGYRSVRMEGIQLIMDSDRQVDFQLQPGEVELNDLVVYAERELIRKDQVTKSTTLTAADIEALPVENMSDILATQANVSVLTGTPTAKSGYDIRGIDDIRMRGGRNNEVALLIDGIKVANPIFGGFATEISNNAIKQMTIVSGGFSARYGNALSGVINMTTHDGWKQFTGSVAYRTSQPFGIRELTTASGRAQNKQEFSLTLGGPLTRDSKLSFFSSAEMKLGRGDIYLFDDIVWDDHRRVEEDLDDDGIIDTTFMLPTSQEIMNHLIAGLPVDSLHPELDWRWNDNLGPDGRPVHPFDHLTGWQGFGWNNLITGFGKLTWQLDPRRSLAFSAHGDQRYRQRNLSNGYYIYAMASQNVQLMSSDKETFRWSHTLSDRTFYTAHLSRFYERRRTRILKDYSNPYQSYWNRFTADADNLKRPEEYVPYASEGAITDPFEGGVFYLLADNRWYDGDASSNWETRFDLTSQVHPDHRLETGLQFNQIDLSYYSYQNISQLDPFPTIYTHHPREGAAYVQIKSEMDFLVLNSGLRLDYGDSGGEFWENPFDPLAAQVGSDDTLEYNPVVQAKPHWKLSPRVGMAFPITDETVLHFNFGHFYQHPNYRDLYRAGNVQEISMKRGNIIGNPNLEPEKSVQYELGLQQRIGSDFALKLNAWTKETTNQVGSVLVPRYSDEGGDNPYEYAVFVNNNFGSARGIDVEMRGRFGNLLNGSINYTWSRAMVLRATSWDGYWTGDTQESGPRSETLAPWDQPHVFRLMLGLQIPQYRQGTPRWTSLLTGYHISTLLYMESGRPYTPTLNGGEVVEPYSARWPAYRKVDLLITRQFKLPRGRLKTGLEIRNLFDRRNVLTGYYRTGSATYPGTSSWYTRSSSYWDSRNNNNFGLGRTVRFSLEVSV